jgi:hypothetical protein
LKKEQERKNRNEKIKLLKNKYEQLDSGKIGPEDFKIYINQVKNKLNIFRN